MIRLLLLSLLCATANAQFVPPGVNASQRTIGRIDAALVRAQVGHGGCLHGIEVKSADGWKLVSTPANSRPQAQSENGWIIWTGAAAIDATQRSIVQGNASTAYQVTRNGQSVWLPQPSQCLRMDSVGWLGAVEWQSTWACWDSVLAESESPPLLSDVAVRLSRDCMGIETDVTVYRGAGLPQFTYKRWTSPFMVLDGREVLGVIVNGIETPIGSIPKAVPLVIDDLQSPAVVIRTRCGRWLIVMGEGWDFVQMWRPHADALIVACVVNGLPVGSSPVGLSWELSAQ